MVTVEIDIEAKIESAVAEAMDNLDYDEIRSMVEDDILCQVDDHIDWSNAEYNIDIDGLVDSNLEYKGFVDKDDLAEVILDIVENGCNKVDTVAVNLLTRAFNEQSTDDEFHLIDKEEWDELQAQVRALSQIIDTSSVRKTLVGSVVEAYESKAMNSFMLMNVIEELRNERYQAIRYLSKPDLIQWAIDNGFGDLSDMKVADIHKVIL
jgi:hypothetical protein|tara:strand:+ start:721 stop:1344 length:624 start_codon:yes stop_codon:yes gene_type:complete